MSSYQESLDFHSMTSGDLHREVVDTTKLIDALEKITPKHQKLMLYINDAKERAAMIRQMLKKRLHAV